LISQAVLNKASIALIGYSGHAFVVVEVTRLMNLDFIGYCEQNLATYNPYNLKYLGFESDDKFDWEITDSYILGIGDNHLRYRIGKLINSKSKKLINIVHPTSVLSYTLKIGQGNFIGANAIVNALVTIGNFCILNTGCIVEHECKIGD